MHSFIVDGGDLSARSQYLASLTTNQVELIHLVAEKTSLTIKQVKDLSLPLSTIARIPRIVWIEEANLLTVPAQNALLKMLEEPPASTSFYLTCSSAASLLPTIRSRCAHQALKRLRNASRNEVVWETKLPLLKEVMSLSPGDRLTSIIKRDRSQSVLWLSELAGEIRAKLQDPTLSPQGAILLAKIANLVLNAHQALLANCSVSLVTQNFYLLLPHTRSRA